VTACFTGLRSSELRGLRWQDVELDGDAPQVHVRQRADRYRTIGRLKSASGERTIPLGPFAANTLRSLRALERKGDYVFATEAGTTNFIRVWW
jgi:integrase